MNKTHIYIINYNSKLIFANKNYLDLKLGKFLKFLK